MTIKVSLLFVLIVLCCCSNGRSRNELKVLDDSNTEVNGKDLGSMGLDYSVDVLDDDSLAIIHRYLQEDGQERIFYQEMVGGMFQLYSKIYHGSEKPTRIFTEYHRYDEEDYYLDGVEVPYMYAISPDKKSFYVVADVLANSNGWVTDYQLFRIDCNTLKSELIVECAAIKATKDGFTVAQARLTNGDKAKCTGEEIWVMHDENINWEGNVVSISSREYDYKEMEKKYKTSDTDYIRIRNFNMIK